MDIFDKSYRNKFKSLKFIDLFAGIGGFHQALSSFGTKCVFASEWDKHCQDIYFKNYGIKPVGDITEISEQTIPIHDILCAGFPCQAFSISGKQLGFNDTRGTLFFDIARIIKYHKPKLLILENVKNFAKHDDGKTLVVVKKTLCDLGYVVFHKILNASNFGVPQKRERIYILGLRNDLNVKNFSFPTSNGKITKLIDCCTNTDDESYVINRGDIHIKDNLKFETDMFGNFPQKPIRIGTVNKGGQGERIYHEYGHAITLSAYGGGVGAKTGLYLINGKIRKLTPRECARITGFPDEFKLHDNKNISYKQFGNSVVINVLQNILKEIIDQQINI
ncbi:DNA (cytosine-5-)-methyltransferase [Candidatus Halobeggiatoa sp. HSG11]|nr:DNA (cytosine-5-)-methyltransferase [Candidatus Halobeggiatoa sp. HSG11]